MINYNKIINLIVLLALIAITLLTIRFINNRKIENLNSKENGNFLNADLAIFISSPINKKLSSQKHGFEIYYPSDWKYNKSIISDSIYEFIPNIEGTKIEIEAIEKSKVSEDVFNLKPLTKNDLLTGAVPMNYYSFTGLRIKKFKNLLSEEAAIKNNLQKNTEVILLQIEGEEYFYTISALYPRNDKSDYFLSLFSMFCQSFSLKS